MQTNESHEFLVQVLHKQACKHVQSHHEGMETIDFTNQQCFLLESFDGLRPAQIWLRDVVKWKYEDSFWCFMA